MSTTHRAPDESTGTDAADTEVVELTIPAQADLVVLARLTAATVASRADFSIEEIEDLRLAVDELCLSLVGGGAGRLVLQYRSTKDTIEITGTLKRAPGRSATRQPVEEEDLSGRILDALVDDHGHDDGERPHAWLRKRRS